MLDFFTASDGRGSACGKAALWGRLIAWLIACVAVGNRHSSSDAVLQMRADSTSALLSCFDNRSLPGGRARERGGAAELAREMQQVTHVTGPGLNSAISL